jgi:hypothetical protein
LLTAHPVVSEDSARERKQKCTDSMDTSLKLGYSSAMSRSRCCSACHVYYSYVGRRLHTRTT